MPRVLKPKLLWDNNMLTRFENYNGDEEDMNKIWDEVYQQRDDELQNLLECANQYVNGTLYLIGTMQMHGQGYPVSKSLKTDNASAAIEKAINALNKNQNARIQIMLAENELVISQTVYEESDIPSVFSFRCVPPTVVGITNPDELAEHSSSIAPLIRRATKNHKSLLSL